jgi:hypothetical protein
MIGQHYITYCADIGELQAWLSVNALNYPQVVKQQKALFDSNNPAHYIALGFDRSECIYSIDNLQSVCFIIPRHQHQIDFLTAAPIEVLAYGMCGDGENCPYHQIMADPVKLSKVQTVLGVDGVDGEGGIMFCAV